MEKVKTPIEKRVFDIATSSLLLILISPFFVLILLGILIERVLAPSSRNGIFYSETRLSAGQPFTIYKFGIFKKRSLEKAKKSSDIIHSKDLERDKNNLTFVGRIIKLVYMDELPQLINVLKGDISLVGPRPTNTVNSQKLFERGCYAKFLVKGGLTGSYQAQKGKKINQSQEELDMFYVNYCKNNPGWKIVLLDIKIILETILTVLRAQGV